MLDYFARAGVCSAPAQNSGSTYLCCKLDQASYVGDSDYNDLIEATTDVQRQTPLYK